MYRPICQPKSRNSSGLTFPLDNKPNPYYHINKRDLPGIPFMTCLSSKNPKSHRRVDFKESGCKMEKSLVTGGVTGHYLQQINGLRMYYEEYGAGEPLLLIHGGTVTSQMWAPFIPAFSAHFRLIIPDSRGHGRTDNPSGIFSYRLMAEDMLCLINVLGLVKPLVCGYSDGGQIALEMGMHYPGVARAYLVGAAFYKFCDSYLEFVQNMGMEAPGVVDTRKIEQTDPQTTQFWQEQHDPYHTPGYWKTLLTQISTMWLTPLDYRDEDFVKINEPVLYFDGDRDLLAPPEQALAIYRKTPVAEVAIIPGADHFTVVDKFEIVTRILLDFMLRQVPGGKKASEPGVIE
jgi:pimeloyl-ACP methyl ester carboxylesterase